MTKQLNTASFIAILLSLAVTSSAQNENWYLCKFMPWICPQTTASPTLSPSPTTTAGEVTRSPTILIEETNAPTTETTNAPTLLLSEVPSSLPSISGSASPTMSAVPSLEPTEEPTTSPSNQPSSHPTLEPTEIPSNEPSESPTFSPR